jgi:dihydrofolate reductase
MIEQHHQNKVFIATSLDGYIADKDGKVEFLDTFPAPPGDDMGYSAFTDTIDALLMGRNSFETVLGFNIPWPYTKPVFVWSHTLTQVPNELTSKIQIVKGSALEVLKQIHALGYQSLYIDGGKTIQSLLAHNLIDEMTITTVPVVLGDGIPLFRQLDEMKKFIGISSKLYPNGLVQNVYKRG